MWWDKRREDFDIFISQLVLDEAMAGNATAAANRIEILKLFPLLELTPEVNELAKELLITRTIPQKAARDAVHIAHATIHRIDFLMTWNCVHIANAVIIQSVAKICRQYGYELRFICTPQELLGE